MIVYVREYVHRCIVASLPQLYIYIYIYICVCVCMCVYINLDILVWVCNHMLGMCIVAKDLFVWYSHKDINHISNTNIYTNTGGLSRFGYERVYQFLASVHGDTRRETQFLKAYANHTILTSLQHAAHLVMFKISIHLCRSRSKKLNCTIPR